MLVHGSMDRGASFARVVRELGDRHVVRYDRRGYGRSRAAGPPASVAGHVADLRGVITACRAPDQQVVVAGHSYGGVVALGAAAAGQEGLGAVVAFEAPLPWLPWWPGTTAGAAAIAGAEGGAQDGAAAGAGPAAAATDAFLQRMLGHDRWAALPPSTLRDRRLEGPALVAELRSLRGAAPFELEAIEVPVLTGHGSRSSEHHRRAAQHVGALWRRPATVVEGASHGAHLSHPAAFARLVEAAVVAAGA